MTEALFTVEVAAEQLRLHPKTILRFIREGRLRATKVGRQYRILRSDLNALVGDRGPVRRRDARTTAIVDVPEVDAEFARRMTTLLTGARHEGGAQPSTMSVEVIYDPKQRHLKIVVVGDPSEAVQIMQLAQAMLEG
ncbi:helix-turn-helix domain-containing protein [Rhizobium sp. 60-20]|uniref:helix-turn-helix domain-containing protein n=1 Tax=Rhizobium sp. 60-20 TaxID=1895819 RepID=UPI00092948F0|nr:helix-turn-helix domain-containing protein [Rhizobium sp. 60-20]MBN8949867.1 helix-turn-helix domain-containing protein [Rhizobium tropici]OJY62752.1 MAG: hypothetical protein BGP09_16865 [Rhizobium sp. 60-20]